MPPKKNILIYNILFLLVCSGIFLFLWEAPEETTKRLPYDEIHQKFYPMKKKEAGKLCEACHNPENIALPENHPPKFRCLFCHKKVEK